MITVDEVHGLVESLARAIRQGEWKLAGTLVAKARAVLPHLANGDAVRAVIERYEKRIANKREQDGKRLSASQSFNEHEVEFLKKMLHELAQNPDKRATVRSREYGDLMRKVLRMEKRIETQRSNRRKAA